jgi:uncharacterized protein (TIGR03083 family)
MDTPMTKTHLLETLRSKRAEWDALLAQVPADRMTEPGVAGEWSVKDIIAHLTYYERWFADRLHEQLRGEVYHPTELDSMGEARNDVIYEQIKNQSLADVLAASRQAFEKLLAGVEAQPEAFLIEPQTFEGAPGPMLVWEMLRGDVYEHYAMHIPSIKNWR